MKRLIFFFLIILLSALHASESVFMNSAWSARQGRSVTARGSGLASSFLNPASTGRLDHVQLFGDRYNLYMAGFQNMLFSGFYPLFGIGGVSVLWRRTIMDPAMEFDCMNDLLSLNFAKKIGPLSAGAAVKYFHDLAYDGVTRIDRTAFDADAGVQFKTGPVQAGISVLSVLDLLKQADVFTSSISAGVSYAPLSAVIVEADFRLQEFIAGFSAALSFIPADEFECSIGYDSFVGPGAGFSWNIRNFRADYSLSLNRYGLGVTHYFGLNYNFSSIK